MTRENKARLLLRSLLLRQLAICAGSALLWMLAAPPFDLWPLAWVAMAPPIWLWAHAKSARRAGWLGFATGGFMTLFAFHWFAPMMHEHAHLPWPVAVLTLIALSAWQGVSLLLAARAIWWIRQWRKLPMALVAPVAVLALEHVWPVIFPYQLALTQVAAPLVIQSADLLGASLITAMLVAVSGAVFDVVERGKYAWRSPAAVGGVVIAMLGYGLWREGDVESRRAAAPHVKVGLVQPNEPMHIGKHDVDADERRLDEQRAQSRALEAAGAQLIVWSETSHPAVFPQDLRMDVPETSPWRVRDGFEAPVVIGAITEEAGGRGRHFNSAFLFVGERVVARDDKIHRVLGSEWDPLVEWFPSLEGTLPPGFAGGEHPVILPATIDGVTVRMGVMICLEDTLPGHARDVADEHANLLVNMTIDTWFGTFSEPWQHRGLAVLRAVEMRADLVRAVNTGPSGIVYATGRLGPQTRVQVGETVPVDGVVVDAAIMPAGDTLYGTVGNLLPWTCVALTIIGWYLGRKQRKQQKAKKK